MKYKYEIYNDIGSGLSNKNYKFADDTKLAARVKDCNGSFKLQTDIDKLIGWANKWQMQFNVEKCKVLHVRRTNRHFSWLNTSE